MLVSMEYLPGNGPPSAAACQFTVDFMETMAGEAGLTRFAGIVEAVWSDVDEELAPELLKIL